MATAVEERWVNKFAIETRMYIDGAYVTGEGEPLPVEHPGNVETFVKLPGASSGQVKAGIAAARRAFDDGSWSGLSDAQRVPLVRRLMDFFAANRDRLKELALLEAGAPVSTVVPGGVVGAISACNFPFYTNHWKVIPALITGNAVVLRPSPLAPLSALIYGEAAEAAGLPKGVLNVIADKGAEGGVIVSQHRRVDMIAFTGSSLVGRAVMAGALNQAAKIGDPAEPTILDVPDNKNPAAQEEIYGPVVCVIGYRDLDHAVEIANDTIYGLSGHVYGNTKDALAVAQRLRTGTVNVNGGLTSAYASSGGWGVSGVNRERGPEGVRVYQQTQVC